MLQRDYLLPSPSRPHRVGITHWWLLSVSLSVCPAPDLKSKTKAENCQEGKLTRDTGDPWPHLEVKRSKVQVTRPPNTVTENQPYLRNGKDDELQTLAYGWSTMTRSNDMRGDLWPQSCEWLFKSPLARSGGILWLPHYRYAACLSLEPARDMDELQRCLIETYGQSLALHCGVDHATDQ